MCWVIICDCQPRNRPMIYAGQFGTKHTICATVFWHSERRWDVFGYGVFRAEQHAIGEFKFARGMLVNYIVAMSTSGLARKTAVPITWHQPPLTRQSVWKFSSTIIALYETITSLQYIPRDAAAIARKGRHKARPLWVTARYCALTDIFYE